MPRRFFSFLFCTLLTFFAFIATSFSGFDSVLAIEAEYNSDVDNPLNIVIKESTPTSEDSKIVVEPDLGDDQAFPFIPGFGKNSGKD